MHPRSGERAAIRIFAVLRGATLNVFVWKEGRIRLAAFSRSFGTLQFSEYGEVCNVL
jgi:hypothetical protein